MYIEHTRYSGTSPRNVIIFSVPFALLFSPRFTGRSLSLSHYIIILYYTKLYITAATDVATTLNTEQAHGEDGVYPC